MLFELEIEDGSPRATAEETPECEAAVAHLFTLLEPWNEAERQLEADVAGVFASCPDPTLDELADALTDCGYGVKIRSALGASSGGGCECLRNLRHKFLCVTPRGRSSWSLAGLGGGLPDVPSLEQLTFSPRALVGAPHAMRHPHFEPSPPAHPASGNTMLEEAASAGCEDRPSPPERAAPLPPHAVARGAAAGVAQPHRLAQPGAAAGGGGGGRFVVDPRFREQFALAHPTPRYAALLRALPACYRGAADRISPLVQFLCAEMAAAFQAAGLNMPPWRAPAALLSKWQPRRSEDAPARRRASLHVPPSAHPRMQAQLLAARLNQDQPVQLQPGAPRVVLPVPVGGRQPGASAHYSHYDPHAREAAGDPHAHAAAAAALGADAYASLASSAPTARSPIVSGEQLQRAAVGDGEGDNGAPRREPAPGTRPGHSLYGDERDKRHEAAGTRPGPGLYASAYERAREGRGQGLGACPPRARPAGGGIGAAHAAHGRAYDSHGVHTSAGSARGGREPGVMLGDPNAADAEGSYATSTGGGGAYGGSALAGAGAGAPTDSAGSGACVRGVAGPKPGAAADRRGALTSALLMLG